MKFHIFLTLSQSQHIGTSIKNEWTDVVVLCCHGKRSFYVPTSSSDLVFAVLGHLSMRLSYFDTQSKDCVNVFCWLSFTDKRADGGKNFFRKFQFSILLATLIGSTCFISQYFLVRSIKNNQILCYATFVWQNKQF